MRYLCSCLAIPVCLFFLVGCITPRGYIFTHIYKPLDVNMSETPSELNHAQGNIKHFQYQYYVDVRWGSNSIGEIAKENGFERVYFADMEKFSILGIWNKYTVHIYGQ